MSNDAQLPALITALMQREAYGHDVQTIQLIETHISWVILTGPYAYKIKKPVNFGFLDFSTLEKRHFCCNEELRLNRRLAAPLYLEVIAITGTANSPVLAGTGPVIEYAVRMVQFPQASQLDKMLARGQLTSTHVGAIAEMLAAFHQRADIAEADSAYGHAEAVYQPVEENFRQIRQRINGANYVEQIDVLEDWARRFFEVLTPALEQRRQGGFVRECHGDLHLRNLVWYEDKPLAFDCIEFNPALRWIDVISEIAFLVMDLQDRQQHQLAQCFLNTYLEATGDYTAVSLLAFYSCYRAMVRAKVAAIRLSQPGPGEAESRKIEKEFAAYLALAKSYTLQTKPMLIITFGMSASGKSTVSRKLLEQLPALRIRSDVERKRLHASEYDNRSDYEQGLYSPQVTQHTYNRLVALASEVLDAGYNVIIDAANLKQEQRQLFQQLAEDRSLAYVILEFNAAADTLRRRISERSSGVSDADLSILEQQLGNWSPLAEHERAHALAIDTEKPLDMKALVVGIRSRAKNILASHG